MAQMVKNLPAMQERWVQSLGWDDPLEEEMATYSSIPAWRIPWTEEPGRLQCMGSQRVGHDWETNTFTFTIPGACLYRFIISTMWCAVLIGSLPLTKPVSASQLQPLPKAHLDLCSITGKILSLIRCVTQIFMSLLAYWSTSFPWKYQVPSAFRTQRWGWHASFLGPPYCFQVTFLKPYYWSSCTLCLEFSS